MSVTNTHMPFMAKHGTEIISLCCRKVNGYWKLHLHCKLSTGGGSFVSFLDKNTKMVRMNRKAAMSDSDNKKTTGKDTSVRIIRYLLYIIFPPLAVTNRGCATMTVVLLLTLLGWFPGVFFAFLICLNDRNCPPDSLDNE